MIVTVFALGKLRTIESSVFQVLPSRKPKVNNTETKDESTIVKQTYRIPAKERKERSLDR